MDVDETLMLKSEIGRPTRCVGSHGSMIVPGEGVEPSWTEVREIIYQPPILHALNHSTPYLHLRLGVRTFSIFR